ncbi:MAG TPA: HAD family hydrolase [Pyrinomonadaceae bacterium]
MKLAIFDIDGTLTNTNIVDGQCFVRALEDAHGIREINTDWSQYPHTADSGIALRIFQERRGRAPDAAELTKLKERFIDLLVEERAADPALFGEIPGAAAAFDKLRDEDGWAVAIATGCWRGSALLKLEAAGIQADGVPIACADDFLSREEILLDAASRAMARYRQTEFEKIVSIGDGVWDVRTALRLGFSFLGIGSGSRQKRLEAEGAQSVLEDYNDFAQVIRCLNEAEIPQLPQNSEGV